MRKEGGGEFLRIRLPDRTGNQVLRGVQRKGRRTPGSFLTEKQKIYVYTGLWRKGRFFDYRKFLRISYNQKALPGGNTSGQNLPPKQPAAGEKPEKPGGKEIIKTNLLASSQRGKFPSSSEQIFTIFCCFSYVLKIIRKTKKSFFVIGFVIALLIHYKKA